MVFLFVSFVLAQPPMTLEDFKRRQPMIQRLAQETRTAAVQNRCSELATDPEFRPHEVATARNTCHFWRLAELHRDVPIERRCEAIIEGAQQAGLKEPYGREILGECLADRLESLAGHCEVMDGVERRYWRFGVGMVPAFKNALERCWSRAWSERVVPLLQSGRCEEGIDVAHDVSFTMENAAMIACDRHHAWVQGGPAPTWQVASAADDSVDCAKLGKRSSRWKKPQQPRQALPVSVMPAD